MNTLTTAARITLIVLLVYVAFLVTLAVGQPPEVFRPLFAESGPFEEMSIVLWLLLGGALLLPNDVATKPRMAMVALALVFAAREADWQKRFTVTGLDKISFYASPAVPLMQKLVGGLVFLGIVALLVHMARLLVRYVREQGALRTAPGQVMAFAVVLLPVTKVLDRLCSVLFDGYQVVLPLMTQQLIAAFEEGLEMAIPLLFLGALMLHRAGRRSAAG